MVTQELSNDIRAALSEGLSELEARLFMGYLRLAYAAIAEEIG
jgi:hypothetical protein